MGAGITSAAFLEAALASVEAEVGAAAIELEEGVTALRVRVGVATGDLMTELKARRTLGAGDADAWRVLVRVEDRVAE